MEQEKTVEPGYTKVSILCETRKLDRIKEELAKNGFAINNVRLHYKKNLRSVNMIVPSSRVDDIKWLNERLKLEFAGKGK